MRSEVDGVLRENRVSESEEVVKLPRRKDEIKELKRSRCVEEGYKAHKIRENRNWICLTVHEGRQKD